jgi:mannose-6-phosphate isomerase-like protein (cupin superfamily)
LETEKLLLNGGQNIMAIQQDADVKIVNGTNFSAVHAGPLSQLDNYTLEVPALNRTVKGKLFIKDFLGLTGMQISMNKFPAGFSSPYCHQHKANEEVYIFIKGRGQMQVDGQTIDVEEGSIVRVATGGARSLRNTSDGELQYICIQAKENSLEADTFEDGIRLDKPVEWPN